MLVNQRMVSTDEILQRILSLPKQNVWSVLVLPEDQQQLAVEELQETIPVFTEGSITVISADIGCEALLQSIWNSEGLILIWQFDDWQEAEWRDLDSNRSLFSRDQGGLLLLAPKSVANFQNHSPNFASWVGPRVYSVELETEILRELDRQHRLETLQAHFNQTNDEIIRLAESRELPPDPLYGEWLVLMDRGDLVG